MHSIELPVKTHNILLPTITPSHLRTHPHQGLLHHPSIPKHCPLPNLLLFAIHPHPKWQTHEAVISRIAPFLNILSLTPVKCLA
jgi:hypothetical protein